MRLRVIVVLGGAVLMALELVGSRVLAPYFGNSIFVWGSLIGIFLTALSAGYYLGGMLADRRPRLSTLAHCLLAAAVMVALIPVVADPVNAWLDASFADPRWGSLVATLVLFAVPSTLLGAISPYAIRLEASSVTGMGSTAGVLYALSTAGSIVGTFATSFVLIPLLGVKVIIYLLAAVLFVLAALGYSHRLLRRPALGLAVLLPLCLLVFVVGANGVVPGQGGTTVYETDTLYHHLLVQDSHGIRYLKFDESLQSAMYLDSTEETPFMYVPRMALGLFFEPSPRRALLIGLGAGSLPKLLLAAYPDLVFDVAEIDPAVVDVAREYFYLPDTPGLCVHTADGRDYLERAGGPYDMVFLDAYYAQSIPFHLTTREFLTEVRAKLEPGGVVVANIIGSITGDHSRLFRAMYRTFETVFPEVYVFASVGPDGSVENAGDWQNIILVATTERYGLDQGDFTRVPGQLADGVSWVGPDDLTGFARGLFQDPIPVNDVPLLTDDYAPLDSLLDVYREQVSP